MKYLTLILLVLECGLLMGCAPEYNKARVAKAQTDFEVRKIYNKAELEDAGQEDRLIAAKIIAERDRLIVEANVELVEDTDIMAANYEAADCLLEELPAELAKDSPILVASFVNLDDLGDSSTFGRVVSEHLASRFRQSGYTTIEMKLRTTVFIREGSGEFLLSRELAKIGIKHRAQAVVVGTYAAASKRVYLTIRVINVSDGRVLSSHDYDIPISHDVFKMLLKGKGEDSLDWL